MLIRRCIIQRATAVWSLIVTCVRSRTTLTGTAQAKVTKRCCTLGIRACRTLWWRTIMSSRTTRVRQAASRSTAFMWSRSRSTTSSTIPKRKHRRMPWIWTISNDRLRHTTFTEEYSILYTTVYQSWLI